MCNVSVSSAREGKCVYLVVIRWGCIGRGKIKYNLQLKAFMYVLLH